jgi:hypothetical protein
MQVRNNGQINGSIAAPTDDDSFLKKVGQWAYSSTFGSAKAVIEEMVGRFGIGPLDGVVMHFLEDQIAAPNCLPAGSHYDVTLARLAAEHLGSPLGDILHADAQLRDYFVDRKNAQVMP